MSYYFYKCKHNKYSESWDSFFERFCEAKKPQTYNEKILFRHIGNWSQNALSYINKDGVLILKYEEAINDIFEVYEKIFTFLKFDRQAYKEAIDEVIRKKENQVKIKSERDKKVRKRGSIENWRHFYSEKQLETFNKIHKNVLDHFNYPLK